jgi:hypothetical protein
MAYDEAAGPSGSAELTEATATTGASHDANGIKFNNKNYEDWSEALLAVRQLVNKNKDDSTSGWYRADVILEPDFLTDRSACVAVRAREGIRSKTPPTSGHRIKRPAPCPNVARS